MEHLYILSEQEKRKVKEYLLSQEKFQPLSPNEKTELKHLLLDFVRRVSTKSWERNQGELMILPDIIKILLKLR